MQYSATVVLSLQAFWNWVENYPDEFTMLYQRPQADMAGKKREKTFSNTLIVFVSFNADSLRSNLTFALTNLFLCFTIYRSFTSNRLHIFGQFRFFFSSGSQLQYIQFEIK